MGFCSAVLRSLCIFLLRSTGSGGQAARPNSEFGQEYCRHLFCARSQLLDGLEYDFDHRYGNLSGLFLFLFLFLRYYNMLTSLYIRL